ncbi:chaperonin 10-like protein [Aspergillus sergii]|uniref:Chaperonin 10-like protein n=1 Tax=Aspergillus sergii TaxID=1034303 RepID=A0A5N6X1L2_9EURO|nr:chaperonin 10-like protein [Aspergillus sergii]
MKEATVTSTLTVTVKDAPIPSPQPGQLLIRVVAAGLNPKDWKLPLFFLSDAPPSNQGDDIAGYVEAVGDGVVGFKKGDRVAALHQMFTPHGGYAEYAIAWAYTAFHVSDNVGFEEAATIPLAATTAALALYQTLSLPMPWNPQATDTPTPLVIYGGSTAVGSFAVKLASLSNIHPLIVIAGNGASHVETLIDRGKGDTIIDYRNTDSSVLQSKIKDAAKGAEIHHVFDAIAENGTYNTTAAALTAPGKIAAVWPPRAEDGAELPKGIEVEGVMVGSVHADPPAGKTVGDREFAAAFFAFIARGLTGGWFSGHPVEVRQGGLNGIQQALSDLQKGKASAVKYVLRVGETEGVQQQ